MQHHRNARSQPGSSAVSEMVSAPGTCHEWKPGAEPPRQLWAALGPAQLTLESWLLQPELASMSVTWSSALTRVSTTRHMLQPQVPLRFCMARSQPRYFSTPGICHLQIRQLTAKGGLLTEGMLSSSFSLLHLHWNKRNRLANPAMSLYLCYKALRPLLLLLDYSELVLSSPAVL